MSAERWCIHHAGAMTRDGAHLELRAVMPRTDFGGSLRFAYALTSTRELLPHAECLARIVAREPRPRVIRVAVRPTYAEADTLATAWGAS